MRRMSPHRMVVGTTIVLIFAGSAPLAYYNLHSSATYPYICTFLHSLPDVVDADVSSIKLAMSSRLMHNLSADPFCELPLAETGQAKTRMRRCSSRQVR